MKTFKRFIEEDNLVTEAKRGSMSISDIFTKDLRRDNRNRFIDLAIKGELVDVDGNKLPSISADSGLVVYLKTHPDQIKNDKVLQAHIKDAYGKSFGALNVNKIKNGFSTVKGGNQAEAWESIICVAYNMLSTGDSNVQNAVKAAGVKGWSNELESVLDAATDVVKNAFGDKPSGIMKHYGSGTATLTKKWDEYFIATTGKGASSQTKTPKTDMFNDRSFISLKKKGGSQLMSGGKPEALATLAFAFDNIPEQIKTAEFTSAWNNLSTLIERDFAKIKMPSGTKIDTIKATVKEGGQRSEIVNTVIETIEKHHFMNDALQKLLTHQETKTQIVLEAMTGNNKFQEKNAIATHIMVFDETGSGKSEFKVIDEKLASYYASRTTFDISFKSAKSSAWTALKLILKEHSSSDPLKRLIEESYDSTVNHCINEGIFDKIKSGIKSIRDFFSQLLSNIWNRLKSLVLQGLGKFKEVFGIEIDANDPEVVW